MKLSSLGLALASFMNPAAAQTAIGFDPPVKVIEIISNTMPRSRDDLTCYVYDDVTIRISGADSPSPDDALIVPQPRGAPAECGRSRPKGMQLTSAGLRFDGRLGGFLVFEVADPSGASYFSVFNVRNGRQLFQDGLFGADGYRGLYGIISVRLNQGILHMRYLRGVNTGCSLLSDRYGCWSQLLSHGKIPRAVFSGPPSVETCKKNYESNQIGFMSPTPDNDPSIVSYEVALTLDSKGNAGIRPMGTPHCDPMP